MTRPHDAITFEIDPPAVRLGEGRIDVSPDVAMEALMAALNKLKRALDSPLPESLEEVEKRHITHVIESTDTYAEAAERLGITKKTLWVKRRKYGLHINEAVCKSKKVKSG